jgi:hypothetical protein
MRAATDRQASHINQDHRRITVQNQTTVYIRGDHNDYFPCFVGNENAVNGIEDLLIQYNINSQQDARDAGEFVQEKLKRAGIKWE